MRLQQDRRSAGKARWWTVACLTAVVGIPGLFVSGARADIVTQDRCALEKAWEFALMELHALTTGSHEQLQCEPIPLVVEASHYVYINEQCLCTGYVSNKFVELQTNVNYRYSIYDGGGPSESGYLTTVANDLGRVGDSADGKAVLYHPPDPLGHDETREVWIEVVAVNSDSDKPVQSSLAGYFIISLRGERRLETETNPDYTVTKDSDYTHVDIEFIGDLDEGAGGSEVIYDCDPNVVWEPDTDITGDFWLAEKNDPLTVLVAGDIIALEAEAEDIDTMVLQCAGSGGCEDGVPEESSLSDVIEYTWSATAGSFAGGHNQGSHVIYMAPEDPAITEVTLTLTLSNNGLQHDDVPVGIEKTFQLQDNESKGTGAYVTYVDSVTYPTYSEPTPRANVGSVYTIPYYSLQKFGDPSDGVARHEYWPFRWTGSVWEMEIAPHTVLKHPYQAVAGFWYGAKQDTPPTSFADYDEVEAWANDNSGDLWVAEIAEIKASRRRNFMHVEEEDIRFDAIAGQIPIKGTVGFDLAQLSAGSGGGIPPSSGRILIEREVLIRGDCSSRISVRIISRIGYGRDLAQLIADTTNRFPGFSQQRMKLEVSATSTFDPVRVETERCWPDGKVYKSFGDDPLTVFDSYTKESIIDWVSDQPLLRGGGP